MTTANKTDHSQDFDEDRAVFGFVTRILLLFVGGVVLIAIGGAQVREILSAKTWPVTEGQVTDAYVEETTRYRRGIETHSYTVRVTYDYEVAGMPYTGNRISLGTIDKNPSTAFAYLDRYPIGSTVDVHYHPTIASRATLDTEIPSGSKVMMIAGGVMLLLGVGGLFFVAVFGRRSNEHQTEFTVSQPDPMGALPLRRPI